MNSGNGYSHVPLIKDNSKEHMKGRKPVCLIIDSGFRSQILTPGRLSRENASLPD